MFPTLNSFICVYTTAFLTFAQENVCNLHCALKGAFYWRSLRFSDSFVKCDTTCAIRRSSATLKEKKFSLLSPQPYLEQLDVKMSFKITFSKMSKTISYLPVYLKNANHTSDKLVSKIP